MLLSITKIDNNTDQGDIDVSNTEPQKVLVSMFWWCKTYFMVSMHFDNWRMHSAFISFHVEIGCIWLRKFRLNLCVVHMIYLGFRFGKNFKWTSFSRPRYIRWRIWKHSFLINYWGAAMHVSVFCAVYKGTTSFFLSVAPTSNTRGKKRTVLLWLTTTQPKIYQAEVGFTLKNASLPYLPVRLDLPQPAVLMRFKGETSFSLGWVKRVNFRQIWTRP